MPGIKRQSESGDNYRGKRTKVKDASAVPTSRGAKKNYVPPSFQKRGITKGSRQFNKEGKLSKELAKAGKSKISQKQKRDDDDEEPEDTDLPEDSDEEMDSEEDNDMEAEVANIEEEYGGQQGATGHQSQAPVTGKNLQSNEAAEPGKDNSSRESHAKQKALALERKAAKPNADVIARSKKLWERLRRKSHVPLEERKKLVAELFEIVTGRVNDFVFKHDSVRVVQTALKYASLEQRKQIAQELRGNYKSLAESRYAKFLVGKLLVHGDAEIRDLIIPEFYGHVKRLIRHPEASWILDDVYRGAASKGQKANLLREWYGAEFSIFKDDTAAGASTDLSQILAQNPEKRGPIMHNLYELINQLVQKKTNGFTMLHDAMLQYFLNTKPGSTEANEFIELIKGDEEGDLAKNMAFTKSGAKLMCLCLAYSSAKDRKLLLRFYRDTVKMMAGDIYGHMVILAAIEVIDDTKLSSKSIFPELLSQDSTDAARHDELLRQVNDNTARIPVLYLFAGDKVKWLLPENDQELLQEIFQIRTETSKKEPAVRRQELLKAASPTLLEFIAARANELMETSFGCQFIAEVLFDADGDKSAALNAVAVAAKAKTQTPDFPFVGRMLKSLVQGGRFNTKEKKIERVDPPLQFHSLLYSNIKDDVVSWAGGSHPFVIVALVESDDFDKRDELLKTLKKNRKALEKAASPSDDSASGKKKSNPASSGAKLLLEKL